MMINTITIKPKKNHPLCRIILKLRSLIFSKYSRKSYSQFGEDLVLSTFLDKTVNGFYVDIGAYHPYRFSNTSFYYNRGCSGINIDAKPGSMNLLNKKRTRDVNLEIGISKDESELNFYIFKESAYNTFSKEHAEHYIEQGEKLDKKVIVKTMSIASVLDQYLPANTTINFISIDVEGMDLTVLQSNNWDKYKPEYILIENHGVDIETIIDTAVYKFLHDKNYKLISRFKYVNWNSR